MRQGHRDKADGIGNEKNTDADEQLDEKLKELGDEFLDDDVPDSLLDVLRRGMGAKSDVKPEIDDAENHSDSDDERLKNSN